MRVRAISDVLGATRRGLKRPLFVRTLTQPANVSQANDSEYNLAWQRTIHRRFSAAPAFQHDDATRDRRFSVKGTQNQSQRCWNCGRGMKVQSFFCGCGAVQRVDGSHANFFDLLGCEPNVKLDVKQLEQNFRGLQRQLHPDKFAAKSHEEKEISAENASVVNVAYSTLMDPVQRARYLLQLIKEGNAMKVEDTTEGRRDLVPNMDLLMQVFEIRERLEMCECGLEANSILHWSQKSIVDLVEELQHLYEAGDIPGMEAATQRLQYLEKISEDAQAKIHHITDTHQKACCGTCSPVE